MVKLIARWESQRGKHYVELTQLANGDYHYSSDGAGGFFQAGSKEEALKIMEIKITYLFPDNLKVIKRTK